MRKLELNEYGQQIARVFALGIADDPRFRELVADKIKHLQEHSHYDIDLATNVVAEAVVVAAARIRKFDEEVPP